MADTHDTEDLIAGNENHVLSASFLGFESKITQDIRVEINYNPTTHSASASVETGNQTDDLIFGSSGRSETVTEVLTEATPFGRSEWQKWETIEKTLPESERPVRLAIKLVELTIAHDRCREDVGGPVDALEITANGIRWVQRKPNCSDQPQTLTPELRKILESAIESRPISDAEQQLRQMYRRNLRDQPLPQLTWAGAAWFVSETKQWLRGGAAPS